MSQSTYLQAPPKRKLLGLVAVVVLHGLLFWAIQAGLTRQIIQTMPVVVQAMLLEEKRAEAPPTPPPPPPKSALPPPLPTPPAYVPPTVTPSVVATPNAIAAVSPTPPQSTPTPAMAAPVTPTSAAATVAPQLPVRAEAAMSAGSCKNTREDFPLSSRRLEEEGTVLAKFLINFDGRVSEVEIERSSGFKRLDDATRSFLMNPSKCSFTPATINGKPVSSWSKIQVTWRLE